VEGLQAQKVGGGYGIDRDFKETIQRRVRRDPAFRRALLREAAESMLSAIRTPAKPFLRDYINSTMAFGTGRGNSYPTEKPHADARAEWESTRGYIFDIMAFVQRHEGVSFR